MVWGIWGIFDGFWVGWGVCGWCLCGQIVVDCVVNVGGGLFVLGDPFFAGFGNISVEIWESVETVMMLPQRETLRSE
jgi:hypothetical protein